MGRITLRKDKKKRVLKRGESIRADGKYQYKYFVNGKAKSLQYLMGHSDISVTMNVYTHIGFDDAEEELKRMEEFRKAQAESEKKNDAKAVSQKMFKVV